MKKKKKIVKHIRFKGKMEDKFSWSRIHTVFDFNREPIHKRGERSPEGFNMRNIPFKHGRVEKHNFIRILMEKQNFHLVKVQWAEKWTNEQFMMILIAKHFTIEVGLMVTILFLSARLHPPINMCRHGQLKKYCNDFVKESRIPKKQI